MENPINLREEWDAFDLITDIGIKIEVKSASYIQSWEQRQLSTISFSIKKASHWDDPKTIIRGEAKRHADVYAFCHLKHLDQTTINPLKMEQWDFYILSTFRLDGYERSQSSITLNSLRKLTDPKKYNEINAEIENAYSEQKLFLRNHQT